MSVRVIFVAPMPPNVSEPLAQRFGAMQLPPEGPQRDAFLAEHADTISVAVGHAGGGVNADLMARLPALELVAHNAVGYDVTDVAAATERGIALTNTPDVLNDCTADLAVGLTLDTLRQISASDRYIRAGHWRPGAPFPLTRRVTGAAIGILGLGRIGTAVAERLAAFRCPISYHSRRPVADVAYTYYQSATELAAAVDVLVVVTPGGPGTIGLVNADVLAALGPAGYLVNIARGSVVDTAALIDALQRKSIAGAGLDVYPDEPNVPPELWTLDNVVLTPHMGSGTVETRQQMADLTIANITGWLERRELVTPV